MPWKSSGSEKENEAGSRETYHLLSMKNNLSMKAFCDYLTEVSVSSDLKRSMSKHLHEYLQSSQHTLKIFIIS